MSLEKLAEISKACKGGMEIVIDDNNYQNIPVDVLLQKLEENGFELGIPKDVRDKIIETNCLVRITVYPESRDGYYKLMHYDLATAIDKVWDYLKTKGKIKS